MILQKILQNRTARNTAGAGVITLAIRTVVPFIVEKESKKLQAYRDIVRFKTIWYGEAKRVGKGGVKKGPNVLS